MYKFLTILLLSVTIQYAQDSFSKFNDYISNDDFENAKLILDNWGENKENDPQYYICNFNYYFNKSRESVIAIENEAPAGKSLQIQDKDTGEPKGYIGERIVYDEKIAQQGIDFIKKGIEKFPDHFEMRFGLMFLYRELKQWDNYLLELENTLKYLTDNNPEFVYWNNNEKIVDPSFTIETIQGALFEILNEHGPEKYNKFMHSYCDLMIKYFPNNKYGYSNKGVLYYYREEDADALKYYEKARSIDKDDMLILFNIGVLQAAMNQKEKAKKSFNEIISKNSDPYYVDESKKQLEMLDTN